MQKQTVNSNNCGLSSIAVATALGDPSKLEFVESEMHNHLKTCFEEGAMSTYVPCKVVFYGSMYVMC